MQPDLLVQEGLELLVAEGGDHPTDGSEHRSGGQTHLKTRDRADGDAARKRGVLHVRRREAAAHEAREGEGGDARRGERHHRVGDAHVAVLGVAATTRCGVWRVGWGDAGGLYLVWWCWWGTPKRGVFVVVGRVCVDACVEDGCVGRVGGWVRCVCVSGGARGAYLKYRPPLKVGQ